jgi:hypothetical protein
MRVKQTMWRRNCQSARSHWGKLERGLRHQLRMLTNSYGLSIGAGDLKLLGGRWYVTHSGLLGLARRRRCSGIKTYIVKGLCEPHAWRWVFRATVYTHSGTLGFTGYGDADPTDTSALVRGAEMRVAETRAVNRALRKAYGIGICSVEELGSQPFSVEPPHGRRADPPNGNGRSTSEPRLRDKLCLLIRKYQLDPTLVKRYAADFCGTETLRDASRDLVEAFISTLAEETAKDRAALICKLNSYNQLEEVKS